MTGPLAYSAIALPPPYDRDTAARLWGELCQSGADMAVFERARPLLDAVFGASPFLREFLLRDLDFAAKAVAAPPDALLDDVSRTLTEAAAAAASEKDLKQIIRRARMKAALVIALADLAGVWSLSRVTEALTAFAETALAATVDWLLAEARRTGKLLGKGQGSGYTVLAMGKFGARELNYSSDIDLIVLFDPGAPLAADTEPATFFVRLTKRLVTILQDMNEDGYGFRVDLRLRPDPRATQIAISIEAAAIYYENMGQNWERAAMIKARAVAGDIALGEEFLARLVPYVWRKYLDFAAIADVQSLKRQIHAVKGHGEIAVLGHNLKLGRGGIREIEFFVQTQQLIAGGRNPKLRGRETVAMLDALAEAQWITPDAARELKEAYAFLRRIEHRIQMIADEQTHTLPDERPAFESLARFSGFASGDAFEAELRRTFELVQGHYAALFKDAEDLGTEKGSLVFTGGEDDPETIETLKGLGFKRASEVAAMIRSWHFGRFPATRSARARERLTEIMPALLTALGDTGDADQAFIAFDRFLAGLPTGVQLFSLLKSNPKLLDLLATILGSAPRLAGELSHRPKVLDAVLDPGFFGPPPKAAEIARLIAAAVPDETPLDEVIDRVRVVAKEQAFRVGVRILAESVSAAEAGISFSDLADIVLARLHKAVSEDMTAKHGTVPGGRSAVMAMGKLGGREMTAGSDLDLVLVYDFADGAAMSDGKRPLSANQYFTRLTQRLIAALTAPTAEGVLYEVDMRLRPSGSKGPVATSLDSFRAYHAGDAWTWERLALTRARIITGDAGLTEELEEAIRSAIAAPRDAARTIADVLAMRALMVKENPPTGPWDIKRSRGGLIDVEFIAQTLMIIHAASHPEVLHQATLPALARLASARLISSVEAKTLQDAGALYQRLTQILRLSVTGAYVPATAPAGLNRLVSNACTAPDIASAEALLSDTRTSVSRLFSELIGEIS
jgi:[glutamine synthetase] adenylyltransferase / [glutamine synthetase]-adenylyl-L-tyrosine phosphorylase